MAEPRPDGPHERLVRARHEPVRHERRQAPVLAAGVVAVRRGAHGRGRGDRVLPRPRVGSAGVDADRQVLHESQVRGRPRELLVEEPLEPLVVRDALPPVVRHSRDRAPW